MHNIFKLVRISYITMVKETTKGVIFKYLKDHGSSDLNCITEHNNLDPDKVLDILEGGVKDGFLIRTDTGKYKLKIVLDSPIPTDVLKEDHHHYDWEEIQRKKNQLQSISMGGGSVPDRPTGSADRTDSPFLKYMPWFMQSERGTCVGHATANIMQANYYAMTGDLPTADEMKGAQRDILLPIWNNLCSIRYDKWYRTVFSPQWAYYISRVVGNVTDPAGSYCDAAIKAMVQYGCCLWDECLTDKGARCTPQLYSELIPVSDTDWTKWQPQFEPAAFKHKLTGYATIRTFEGLMTAIEQSGGKGVIMPINLEMDYLDVEEDGTWKAHPGAMSKAGGHALWWCSVDRVNRKVRCLNSWGDDFVKYTWIDEQYYDENAGAAFAAIDDTEVKIGEILYSKVKISSNVPCSYTINGAAQIGDPLSIALERTKDYTIIAIPNNLAQVKEIRMSASIRPVLEEATVVFTFTVLPPSPPKKTLTEMIVELIRKILAIFGK